MTLAPRARTLALLVIATEAVAAAITSGCGGSYRAEDTATGADASADGMTTDGTTSDAAAEANACAADLLTDAKNCGRCGHDCLGGDCESGKCNALHLAETGGRLSRVVRSGSYIFTSSLLRTTTETGGLWRVPVSGGAQETYVTFRHVEGFAVLGDLLYFVVDEPPVDGVDNYGGFYSCPLVGPAPCVPTLIAVADSPREVTVDQGRVFYNDKATPDDLMSFAPPGPPAVFRSSPSATVGLANNLYVDGPAAFITLAGYSGLQQFARLWEVRPDGSAVDTYAYTAPNATRWSTLRDAGVAVLHRLRFQGRPPAASCAVSRARAAGSATSVGPRTCGRSACMPMRAARTGRIKAGAPRWRTRTAAS